MSTTRNPAEDGAAPDDAADPKMRSALKSFLLENIGKEQLVQSLEKQKVSRAAFNSLVLGILAKGVDSSSGPIPAQKFEELHARPTQRLRGVLSQSVLAEIKKDLSQSTYIPKPCQQFSLFRRTPEDLSAAVSGRPHLIALFSAQYNVLCGKIRKVLSIRDLWNKMKKSSFEYKLTEHVPMEVAECAHECLIHYLKKTIGNCVQRGRSRLRLQELSHEVYGNIYGVYLLHEEYPPQT